MTVSISATNQWRLKWCELAEELSADLVVWRKVCPDPSAEAFIFLNTDGGFQDTDAYRKQVPHKLAEILNLPKLTFQMIRRTIATLSQRMGTVEDTQGLLRHSRTPTRPMSTSRVQPKGESRWGIRSTRNCANRPAQMLIWITAKGPALSACVSLSGEHQTGRGLWK